MLIRREYVLKRQVLLLSLPLQEWRLEEKRERREHLLQSLFLPVMLVAFHNFFSLLLLLLRHRHAFLLHSFHVCCVWLRLASLLELLFFGEESSPLDVCPTPPLTAFSFPGHPLLALPLIRFAILFSSFFLPLSQESESRGTEVTVQERRCVQSTPPST